MAKEKLNDNLIQKSLRTEFMKIGRRKVILSQVWTKQKKVIVL